MVVHKEKRLYIFLMLSKLGQIRADLDCFAVSYDVLRTL